MAKTRKRLSSGRLNPQETQNLQTKLLAWYAQNQRDLPWRTIKDAFAIWVSEVMLQQTQVKTVIPYYKRFLEHFPSIDALANGKTEDLLRVWAGLGYYSRARNLQNAAQIIVERFGGKFPSRYDEVLALPGIGRYTAAAILSIAFDQPYAVLDGNVARVLARVLRIEGDPKNSKVQQLFWTAAQALLPLKNSGNFNQAIMELGATVCSPRQPRCLLCPWQKECLARKHGLQEILPMKSKRPVIRKARLAAAAVQSRGRYLLIHRGRERLLRDFWEFPTVELGKTENVQEVLTRWIHRMYGLIVEQLEPLATVKHSITVRRIELQVFHGTTQSNSQVTTAGNRFKWVRLSEMERYPFASSSRQILQALQKRTGSQIRT